MLFKRLKPHNYLLAVLVCCMIVYFARSVYYWHTMFPPRVHGLAEGNEDYRLSLSIPPGGWLESWTKASRTRAFCSGRSIKKL